MFKIRPETVEDYDRIRSVNQLAFEGVAEANLVDALRDGGYVEVSLVAETEGTIVGHILFSRVNLVTTSETLVALSLAPMSVLPAYQQQGIGSQLVKVGLDYCQKLGHAIIVVLGHPAFYSRLGFSAELAKNLESPFGGGDAWMAYELIPGSLSDIHGHIEYPPPFLALD